jgi:HK97 family phage prohead protease
MDKIERRFVGGNKVEVRKNEETGKQVVRGYAAVFDSLSENLGGFREKIAPGAFDGVLDNDVRALIDHNSSLILGRTTAGTLRLGVDERGLWYEYDDPGTSYSKDLLISMERGDVNQSSFGFRVLSDGQTWEDDPETGAYIRTITNVYRLYDVSPVTFPAYPDTDVAKRSLDAYTESRKAPVNLNSNKEKYLKLIQLNK